MSDADPDLSLSESITPAPFRFVIWRRILRTDVPKGWLQWGSKMSALKGYCRVPPTGDVRVNWSRTVKYKALVWRKKFLNKDFEIVDTSWDEFSRGYSKSLVHKKLYGLLMRGFGGLYRDRPENVNLWGVRHVPTGKIVAGLGVLNSPSSRSSYYSIGFYLPGFKEVPLMVGLFDHWFQYSQMNNIDLLQLGGFWQKGDPKEWKGYSTFKSKFGTEYVEYQPKLVRILGWSK